VEELSLRTRKVEEHNKNFNHLSRLWNGKIKMDIIFYLDWHYLIITFQGIMTSYQFNNPTQVPSWLLSLLSVNSVVLISMHSFAFVIGTCLLPTLNAVNEEYVPPQEGQETMKPVPDFSPHKKFSGFIKTSHRISHIFGLFVFLIEVPLVAWVKFWDVSTNAAIASSVTMIPFLVGFVIFYWCFNFEYKSQIYESRQNAIDEVEKHYLSRLSIDLSSMIDVRVQEEETGLGRRHSIHADVSPPPPTPDMARRKYHSMHDINLEPVQE
jgi:Mediator of CRAC channel activity